MNTEGLLVRTSIYEGNRHDSTTLEEVIGSVSNGLVSNAKRVVVMDAGFYSASNVKWLTDHNFDYITVLPLPRLGSLHSPTRSYSTRTAVSRRYAFNSAPSPLTMW